MSGDTLDDYVVSFKPHAGYDSPLFVIKAASAAALVDKINAADAVDIGAIIGKFDASLKAVYVAGSVLGATPVNNPSTVAAGGYGAPQAPPAPAYGAQPGYGAPAAPAGPPGMVPPTCMHGVKTFKTGQGAKGTWRAWMCPGPKGPGQCKPEWING